MLLRHIPTGDLYPQTPQLMARVGKDMEVVSEEAPAAPEPVKAAEPAKRVKGKAIQIEGEE